jgi:hypothetical protein
MADKKLSDQQRDILGLMAVQVGMRDYKEIAEAGEIKEDIFLAQLSRLKKQGLVEQEKPRSSLWQITDAGVKANLEAAEATEGAEGEEADRGREGISREEMGLTEYQIFIKYGRQMGGIPQTKLDGIAGVVFGDDPYDLDKVWQNLSEMNVAIDLRKQWFKMWQNYLRQAGKPADVSTTIQAQLTPADKRTPEQVRAAEEQGRDWDLVEDDEGLQQPERVGPGLGEFTLKEATQVMALKNRAMRNRAAAGGQGGQFAQEPMSQLLTALQPYINKDTDQGLLKWIITDQLDNMAKTITDSIPRQQGGQGIGDFLEKIPQYAETLKTLAPILRAALGVPEAGSNNQPQAQSTPIQMTNPDGSPVVFQLNDFITLKKFEAEQKREDESSKQKEIMFGTIRGFIERFGKAAERAAGAQ